MKKMVEMFKQAAHDQDGQVAIGALVLGVATVTMMQLGIISLV